MFMLYWCWKLVTIARITLGTQMTLLTEYVTLGHIRCKIWMCTDQIQLTLDANCWTTWWGAKLTLRSELLVIWNKTYLTAFSREISWHHPLRCKLHNWEPSQNPQCHEHVMNNISSCRAEELLSYRFFLFFNIHVHTFYITDLCLFFALPLQRYSCTTDLHTKG